MISTIPKSVAKALNIFQPQPPPIEVTELDAQANVMMRPDSQPALTSSYKFQSLLFSVGGCAEHNLRINRSRSEKKSVLYVAMTLKKRKTIQSRLETKAYAGSDDMNE